MASVHRVEARSAARLPAGMLGAQPQVLLLDFDGVIVDSVKLKVDAYLTIYAGESPDKLAAVLDYQRRHAGETRRVKFRHFEAALFGRSVTHESIEALSREYTRLVHDAVLQCALIPGAGEFLDAARGAATMHVVSGTPHEELADIVLRRGLAPYFASLHGAPATKPAVFRELAMAAGVPREQVLAIGDGTTEFDAAAAIGIPFLGVVPPEEPSPFPAHVPVVASLAGLATALGYA
jgi:phosphoglycolate phosphatase-like HAD superfamily hydrolase